MVDAVAIIPARGGSKRIPRKNIRDFNGKPALAWPIGVAQSSGLFSRVIVSTDDSEIAECAIKYHAEVPFFREASLSDDTTGTTEVIRDAVGRLDLAPETLVCCIYATALFIRSADLMAGHNFIQNGAIWAMTIAEYPTPIGRAYHRDGDRLIPRHLDHMHKRSQDLEPSYFDAGQFYWAKRETWLNPNAAVWDGATGVEIPFLRAIDIDTEADWKRAEFLAPHLKKQR